MSATKQNPESVRIISEGLCEVHGWVLGGGYAVINRPVEVPDKNGFDVWIESPFRKHAVKLSSSEYQLIS